MIGWAHKVVRRLAAEAREFRRWEALRRPADVRAYYGWDRLPDRNGPISGGIVKCLDLAERFPNSPDKANLLYLVSSALPDRRGLLARAARRAGGRVVLNQNGVAYPAWAGADWQAMNAPNARVHARADFVVYQSEFCRRCAERFLGARKGPGEVLYNPVDTTKFRPPEVPIPFDPVRLLLAGSHHQYYRVQTAVDVLAQVRDSGIEAVLEIAGRYRWETDERSAENSIRNYVEKQGLTAAVTFSGPYTQEQAWSLFQRAHILIHTKYNDPCPRLVVEAMASGLPVVYSASGGVPELVGMDAGIGVFAPMDWESIHPPSPRGMADAVQIIVASYKAYSKAARRKAETKHDVQAWIDRHQQIFESLAQKETDDVR
ncbi:MAG: glycosyltransferase family 4 protein [Kiritimatiellia bacterium]